jgi:hypothetical protein
LKVTARSHVPFCPAGLSCFSSCLPIHPPVQWDFSAFLSNLAVTALWHEYAIYAHVPQTCCSLVWINLSLPSLHSKLLPILFVWFNPLPSPKLSQILLGSVTDSFLCSLGAVYTIIITIIVIIIIGAGIWTQGFMLC